MKPKINKRYKLACMIAGQDFTVKGLISVCHIKQNPNATNIPNQFNLYYQNIKRAVGITDIGTDGIFIHELHDQERVRVPYSDIKIVNKTK